MSQVLALDRLRFDLPEARRSIAAGGEEELRVGAEHDVPHPELFDSQLAVELEVVVGSVDSRGSVPAGGGQEERIRREFAFQAVASLRGELELCTCSCQLIATRHEIPDEDVPAVVDGGQEFPVGADVDAVERCVDFWQ